MKFTPRTYQRRMYDHGTSLDQSAKLVDMGLGKTVVELTIFARRIKYLLSRGALIVAPLRVVTDTWPKETEKWAHLKHLRLSLIVGTEKQRRSALSAAADVYLVNYENLIWLSTVLAGMKDWPFDSITFDESSKMKNPSSKRFKCLKPILSRFRFRSILTGTPSPNSYLDLWSQYYLLDQGQRLGRFLSHYRDTYFNCNYFGSFQSYTIKPGAAATIESLVSDVSLSLSAEDHLKMTDPVVNDILVPLPPDARKLYDRFEADMFMAIDGKGFDALNEAVLTAKCRQMTSGAIYDDGEEGEPKPKTRTWTHIHDAKMDALSEIVDEAQGQPILIAYDFKHDLSRLKVRFPTIRTLDDTDTITEWNKGNIPLLAVHPMSAGHGLNLQFGGHIIVWFSLTYSLESYLQLNKRIDRPGQKSVVIIHRLICPKTIDTVMVARVASKDKAQQGFLSALKVYRENSSLL